MLIKKTKKRKEKKKACMSMEEKRSLGKEERKGL
jgi:hypothetical protein